MRNKLELLSLDESPALPPECPPSAAAPPWTELPSDVTANILQRLDALEILQSAQLVCSTWWKVCQDPAMWRVIEIDDRHCNAACRQAVDRSQGQLVDLNITYGGDDELLDYIVNRSSHLRRLTLGSCNGVSGAAVAEAVKKLPELEEFRLLSNFGLVPADIESIGRSCPSLNSFALSFYQDPIIPHNEYAVAISKSMPGLLHLQLDNCELDNIGLEAILDGCPHLQSLHLWGCSRVDLGGALGKRCRDQIKDLVTYLHSYDDSSDNDDYSDKYDYCNYDYDYGNYKDDGDTDSSPDDCYSDDHGEYYYYGNGDSDLDWNFSWGMPH